MCVSHSPCSVCWFTDKEFKVRVPERAKKENWMYHTLWETYGTYYLNVRESTFIIFLSSRVLLFCTFFKKKTLCIIVQVAQTKKNINQKVFLILLQVVSSDGSLSCCCWNDFLTHGGFVDKHYNKIKKSQTIESGICGRCFWFLKRRHLHIK